MGTGFYLLDNENPNAPMRADGRRYWGHPSRSSTLVPIVVAHSAEAIPDYNPPDLSAEGVAGYFTRSDRPASYHRISDSDSRIPLLPFTATAFQVAASGWNSRTIGVSSATQATAWFANELHTEKLLRNLAADTADAISHVAAVTGRVPRSLVRHCEPRFNDHGICSHGEIQADRSDPWLYHDRADDLWAMYLDFTLDALGTPDPNPPSWKGPADMAEFIAVKTSGAQHIISIDGAGITRVGIPTPADSAEIREATGLKLAKVSDSQWKHIMRSARPLGTSAD